MRYFNYIFVDTENLWGWALHEVLAETVITSRFEDGLVCVTPIVSGRSPRHIFRLNVLKRFLVTTPGRQPSGDPRFDTLN